MTNKQERLLRYITEFHMENGYSPSIREIASHFGIKSPSAVKVMIDRLEKQGHLSRSTGIARSLSPVNINEDKGIPILGHIVAGVPVTAEENIEGYIPFDEITKYKKDLFFLVVDGYSMKDKGILPSDYVLIRSSKTINNGQIGAFRINGEVTLKIYRETENGIFLYPANEDFSPIPVTEDDEFEVIGCYVMLIRLSDKGF